MQRLGRRLVEQEARGRAGRERLGRAFDHRIDQPAGRVGDHRRAVALAVHLVQPATARSARASGRGRRRPRSGATGLRRSRSAPRSFPDAAAASSRKALSQRRVARAEHGELHRQLDDALGRMSTSRSSPFWSVNRLTTPSSGVADDGVEPHALLQRALVVRLARAGVAAL